ncbi:MAG: hypothetical protein IJ180_05400 [Bacteroidales bacterium]|nr:hypothetical protein [Bacteroidales bacterium]MBQ9254194.1 hypothetical protein [Bacteroidales bacterium]
MKKLFLALVLVATSFMFWSCEDDTVDSLTGSVKFNLKGTAYNYTGAVSKNVGSKFIITTGSAQGAVAISLENSTAGTYKLGIGNSLTDAAAFISSGLNYEALTNTILFYPFKGGEKYMILGGTCTITSSGNQVKGTFSGVAVSLSELSNIDASALLSIVTGSSNVTGEFIAYKL